MQYQNVSILSLAHVDAPHRVTSNAMMEQLAETAARLDMSTDLLESASGIVARRYWDIGFQPSQAAALAGEKALVDAGIDRSRIGIIINTSVCRDFIEPSTACIVHDRLGLSPDCLNFDLGNACLAFLSGMQMVGNMIDRGQIDYGLIARTTRNIPLAKIQDVTVSASIPQRILGFGNVVVDNASEVGGTTVLHNINDPRHYADLLLRELRHWH